MLSTHPRSTYTETSNGSWRQGIKGEMTCTVYWPAPKAIDILIVIDNEFHVVYVIQILIMCQLYLDSKSFDFVFSPAATNPDDHTTACD